jgi:hypothetical protein
VARSERQGDGYRRWTRYGDERGAVNALPIDDRTFLIDADNPDTPTVTFGPFDGSGHPGALYDMLWGLPRVDETTGR